MSYSYETARKMAEKIKDMMVDVLCGERNIFIDEKRISDEAAKSAYRKITYEHILYILDNIVKYPAPINRIDRFCRRLCTMRRSLTAISVFQDLNLTRAAV